MPTFSGVPTLESSKKHSNNGISQVVIGFGDHLPAFGWNWTPHTEAADLFVYHAGEGMGHSVDVAVVHGLHPTGQGSPHWEVNRRVIQDMVIAKHIIAPSEWVSRYIRHEMKRPCTTVNWGVNLDQWQPADDMGYVIWNKNRHDPVCNPDPMNEAAMRLPHRSFKSTFGRQDRNVDIIGRQPYEQMNALVRQASVYLATTRETGDIGSREALAAGVPVVGFAWGGLVDVVEHGITGYLAEVGDYDGLAQGIEWAFTHRAALRANALAKREHFGWQAAAEKVAEIFYKVYRSKITNPKAKVSIVIPCHNYEAFVGRAIESVLNQKTNFDFEIITCLDKCTDNSHEVVREYLHHGIKIVHLDYGSPAYTRNAGISLANGQYILCLDADDQIVPNMLQTLADALDHDATLGIAYTALQLEHGGQTGFPPAEPSFDLMVSGKNQIPTCCMFRREDWQRVGGYRQYMEPSEDADFFMRLWAWSGRHAKQITSNPMFIYNVHQGSLTDNYRNQQRQPDPFTRRGVVSWATHRPLPAPALNRASNPVYHRDIPLLKVEIEGEHDILIKDALDFQTFRDWTLEDVETPLVARFTGDMWITADYLENALKAGEFPPDDDLYDGKVKMAKKCCGGSKIVMSVKPLSDQETVMVRFKGGGVGSIYIGSATGWKPAADIPATRAYGKKRQGDVFRMLKADYEARPHLFEIMPETQSMIARRTAEPIAITEPPKSVAPVITEKEETKTVDKELPTPEQYDVHVVFENGGDGKPLATRDIDILEDTEKEEDTDIKPKRRRGSRKDD